MDFLKQLVAYSILIALIWGGIVVVRMMSRAHVPSGYSDINGLMEFTSYRVDRNVTINQFKAGDAICYRISDQEDGQTTFAWVAGLPGDAITVSKGQVLINGKPCDHGEKSLLPDCGPIQKPGRKNWPSGRHGTAHSWMDWTTNERFPAFPWRRLVHQFRSYPRP